MSIRAMEEEIENQVSDLPRLVTRLRRTSSKRIEASSLIFTGSGDSYAAALFAQELSDHRSLGADPYELLRTISRVRGKKLAIISVSGKTRTNLELARKSRRIAQERIAITADRSSPLAKECDRTVLLRYQRAGTLTSGTDSFTSVLVACAFLLGKLPRSLNLRTTFERSSRWAREIRLSKRGTLVFVGSGLNHAMAFYGAAKIQEAVGMKAEVEYPEQLGHSHLFSIDKMHDTIVFIYSNCDKTWDLEKTLRKNGYNTVSLNVRGSNAIVNCLGIAFHLQQLALLQAKRSRMRECTFKRDRKTLELSSRLIY